MADPVIPGGIRAQLILQGITGLPEDRYVTTWAFQTPSGTVDELHHQQVATMLQDWLKGTTGANPSIDSMLSGVLVGGVGAGLIKSYDLGQLVPRIPYETVFDRAAEHSSASFPSEVAITASFQGTPNQPRRRGRVYVGPLKASTGEMPNFTGRVNVTAATRLIITDAMARLQAWARPEFVTWCILSQTNAALVEVTGGYVDDAFDTQRRRGEEPVNRTSWTAP